MRNKNLFLVLSLVSIGFHLEALAAKTLAQINSTTITDDEFNRRYKDNLKYFQFKIPSKQSVLDDLIKRELGIQQAKKLNLDKDPEVIDRVNTVLYHALIEKQLGAQFEKIHVSDEEASGYYKKSPELRTSHIFVAVAPGATKEQEKAAFDKIKKIQDTYLKDGKMTFAEVAQRFSEGVAAPMGGDIDYQTRDRLDASFYDEALKLKTPGKMTGIVRTQFGYHIIKLTAVRSWDDVDKAKIKRIVYEEKRNELFEDYMKKLRAQSKVTVNTQLLKD